MKLILKDAFTGKSSVLKNVKEDLRLFKKSLEFKRNCLERICISKLKSYFYF